MGKTFDLKDAGLFCNLLKTEIHDAVMRGLLAAAYRTVEYIVADVMPALPQPPVDRGAYRSGWRAKREHYGALVENTAPHAPFIEFGVRAANVKIGRAMIDALTTWVKRKGLGGRIVLSVKGARHVKATDTEARSIAWAIAKTMQKHGIFDRGKGLRVLAIAERRIPEFIRVEVGRALKTH